MPVVAMFALVLVGFMVRERDHFDPALLRWPVGVLEQQLVRDRVYRLLPELPIPQVDLAEPITRIPNIGRRSITATLPAFDLTANGDPSLDVH
jgi:hypothetical protein